MHISPKHADARDEAGRLPALQASLDLLSADTQTARIELYGAPAPAEPGDPPATAPLLAVIPLGSPPGTLDSGAMTITLTTPIEGQIDGADPESGTLVVWARVFDGAGDWWTDADVSLTGGEGEIQLDTLTAYDGAFARLTSVVFQG